MDEFHWKRKRHNLRQAKCKQCCIIYQLIHYKLEGRAKVINSTYRPGYTQPKRSEPVVAKVKKKRRQTKAPKPKTETEGQLLLPIPKYSQLEFKLI